MTLLRIARVPKTKLYASKIRKESINGQGPKGLYARTQTGGGAVGSTREKPIALVHICGNNVGVLMHLQSYLQQYKLLRYLYLPVLVAREQRFRHHADSCVKITLPKAERWKR